MSEAGDSGRSWARCQCGKRGYTSVKAAKDRFRSHHTGAGSSGNRIRIYQCPASGSYHITDMDKSGGRSHPGRARVRRAKQKQQNRASRRNWKRDHGRAH